MIKPFMNRTSPASIIHPIILPASQYSNVPSNKIKSLCIANNCTVPSFKAQGGIVLKEKVSFS